MTLSRKKIAITTGDLDGIGLEVTSKAIAQLPLDFDSELVVYHSADSKFSFTQPYVQSLPRTDSPVDWVEDAATMCLEKKYAAMVTGPLSKTLIQSSGRKDIGHTDILKRLTGCPTVHMSFLGEHMNVVLASGHIPLADVPVNLTVEKIESSIKQALEIRSRLSGEGSRLPVGVLGLNPHAGDDGIIGHFEKEILTPIIRNFSDKSLPVVGPLIPDVAFAPTQRNLYSIYVCLYHDQGLIPFKTLHGLGRGVHFSAGLPFVRTSVDHGTAKDIFGKNIADPNSMLSAIQYAQKLLHQSQARTV